MNKAQQLIETAHKLMLLQAEFAQQITALECDEETSKVEAHMIIGEAISLASSFFEKLKESNKLFLEEMVERGKYTVSSFSVGGIVFEAKTYEAKPVKGYELLNKDDPKVWSIVLAAAAKNNPEVIQKRITDSKVTEQFLVDCQGLVAVKDTGAYTWSVTKAK